MNDKFVDLRQNELNGESFWPSFTDIMMVVVIIFLLTSMLLMVKNWELLDQLRNSMAAEEQATKMVQDTSMENATLEEQLAHAQSEISMLRMQVLQSNERASQLDLELESKKQLIIIVQSENEDLKNVISSNETEISRLNSNITSIQSELKQLNIDNEKQHQELEQEREKIIIITRERDLQANQLTELQDDFGSLKVKYDKLIKPARSTKGKHIVTIDYERIKGKERIRLKESTDSKSVQVTEKQLHEKLTKLKKKHAGNLYVRIIIPEKSGLTYNEAWNFMIGILKKYDYYYQDN